MTSNSISEFARQDELECYACSGNGGDHVWTGAGEYDLDFVVCHECGGRGLIDDETTNK